MAEVQIDYGTPIEVIWNDSTAQRNGWITAQDVKPKVVTITSVGFLVATDDIAMSVTHSLTESGEAYDSFSIPMGCVVSVKEVKLGSKEQSKRKPVRK